MIKCVLFDLDNTLIVNPPNRFVRGYVQELTAILHDAYPQIDVDTVKNALRTAIQCMLADFNPLTLNWEVFIAQFSEHTGLDEAALRPILDRFYVEAYPRLQSLTEPIPEAAQLIQWLLDQGYAVGIATNPLFETPAIHQRLGWTNLDPARWSFAYVTTMNNTHFTKPHPHYFEEILARIGVEPDETLMVGDDWYNDMVGATQAGLNTFWIPSTEEYTLPKETPTIQPDAQGTLRDLLRIITQERWLDQLTAHALSIQQIAPRLMGNVAALLGLTNTVQDHYWEQYPDPNEWSPLEIVTHLRDSEIQVQRPRLERILREENPFISAPLPPPAPHLMDVAGLDGQEVAQAFIRERQKTLDLLAKLTSEQWKRPARHSVLGPTTLLEMAAFTARHDHLHINQLCQTLGRCS